MKQKKGGKYIVLFRISIQYIDKTIEKDNNFYTSKIKNNSVVFTYT